MTPLLSAGSGSFLGLSDPVPSFGTDPAGLDTFTMVTQEPAAPLINKPSPQTGVGTEVASRADTGEAHWVADNWGYLVSGAAVLVGLLLMWRFSGLFRRPSPSVERASDVDADAAHPTDELPDPMSEPMPEQAATPVPEQAPDQAPDHSDDPLDKMTDSMREIGQGRDLKAALLPNSRTGDLLRRQLKRVRIRMGIDEDPYARPQRPRRDVIPPNAPEARLLAGAPSGPAALSAQTAVIGSMPEAGAAKAPERESTVPPGSIRSLELRTPDQLSFDQEFTWGRHTFHYVDAARGRGGENQMGLRVLPTVRGIAEVQAMFRRDSEGRFWVRHIGLNQYEKNIQVREDEKNSQDRKDKWDVEAAKPTMVKREQADHTVPADQFARLEPGDVLYVEAWRWVKKIRIDKVTRKKTVVEIQDPIDMQIDVTEEGLKARDPALFLDSPLLVGESKTRRRDVRRPLLQLKYSNEIRDILHGYCDAAEPAQLKAALQSVQRAAHETRKALVSLEKELRPGRSHHAEGELRLLQNTVAALEDLQQLIHRDLKQHVSADVRFVHSRTDLIGSILLRLRQYRSYREDMLEAYFDKYILLDGTDFSALADFVRQPLNEKKWHFQAVLAFHDFYQRKPPQERGRFLKQVLEIWDGLDEGTREMLWILQGERRAALPPIFLRLLAATAVSLSWQAADQADEGRLAWGGDDKAASTWLSKAMRAPLPEADQLRTALQVKLGVLAHLIAHETRRPGARELAGNARELDLALRTYAALDDNIQKWLVSYGSAHASAGKPSSPPQLFYRIYFASRLSPVFTQVYPVRDGVMIHRDGTLGFDETFSDDFWEDHAKASLVMNTMAYNNDPLDDEGHPVYEPITMDDVGGLKGISAGDMERDLIKAMQTRITKWVDAGMPEQALLVAGEPEESMPPTHKEGVEEQPPASQELALDSSPEASELSDLDQAWKRIERYDEILEGLDPYREIEAVQQQRKALDKAGTILSERLSHRMLLSPDEEVVVAQALRLVTATERQQDLQEAFRLVNQIRRERGGAAAATLRTELETSLANYRAVLYPAPAVVQPEAPAEAPRQRRGRVNLFAAAPEPAAAPPAAAADGAPEEAESIYERATTVPAEPVPAATPAAAPEPAAAPQPKRRRRVKMF